MKKRKIFIISIICLSIIGFIIFSILLNSKDKNSDIANLPRHDILISFALNISNPEIAVDFYPYVFIAKVNKVLRTDYRNPNEIETVADGSQTKTVYEPYTIYDITVIENLKGEIVKNVNIPIEQVGGISKDKDYITLPSGMDFLKENFYYIFLPYSPTDTNELRLGSSYNVIELGTLSNKTIKNEVLEIARETDFSKISNLFTEATDINAGKNARIDKDSDEIKKVLVYKHATMTPMDIEYYEDIAKLQGAKSGTVHFATNMSKYDVNYTE